jgi:hypothetical protein
MRVPTPYDTAVINCLYSVPRTDYVPLCRSVPINCAQFDLWAYQLVLIPLARSHQSARPGTLRRLGRTLAGQACSHCLVRTNVRLDPISSTK